MYEKLDQTLLSFTNNIQTMGIIERVNEEYKRIAYQEGEKKGLRKSIAAVLRKGTSAEQTAFLLEVPLKLVEDVAREMKKNTQ